MAARRTAERSVQLIGRLSKRDFTRSFSFTSLLPSRATWWNALSAHACCHFGAVEQTSGTIQHLRREAMVHLLTLKKTKQNKTGPFHVVDLTATRFNIYIKKRACLLPCREEIVPRAGVQIISTEKRDNARKKETITKMLLVAVISYL